MVANGTMDVQSIFSEFKIQTLSTVALCLLEGFWEVVARVLTPGMNRAGYLGKEIKAFQGVPKTQRHERARRVWKFSWVPCTYLDASWNCKYVWGVMQLETEKVSKDYIMNVELFKHQNVKKIQSNFIVTYSEGPLFCLPGNFFCPGNFPWPFWRWAYSLPQSCHYMILTCSYLSFPDSDALTSLYWLSSVPMTIQVLS